jgi:hypothetical protein
MPEIKAAMAATVIFDGTLSQLSGDLRKRETVPLPNDSRIGVNSLRRMFASARSAAMDHPAGC